MLRRVERRNRRSVRRPVADIRRVVGRSRNNEPTEPSAKSPESQRPWDRDEWDVLLTDGPTYRLFRERHSDKWFLEGVVD